ncbi:hypothetical protein B0T16DRAFT_86895 [Cercophora newfieldiana]|uniref:Uncharacterized protein n=1 Tax=Cercophora newfieldiana TaxID=92897 RepID=A0AA39YFV3_9PEZI|nr:hypothetical protein B0T16DRAFT_86895 [Cercophora newfieldiana]
MDDNRGQRRQNEPPAHSGSSARYHPSLHEQSQQRRSFTSSHGDRFRAPLSTSSAGAARGMGGSTSYGTYGYQDSGAAGFPGTGMGQAAMSYQHPSTDYGQADTRQTQGFPSAYNQAAMIYNVPQATGPQSAAVYDTSQQFPQRPAAGLQMMSTDVANPYFSGEPSSSATASALHAQPSSSAASQVYQQSSLPNYSAGGMAAMGGMTSQSSSAQDVRMEEEYPAAEGLDAAYASYQTALKAIFQNVQDGSLASASESLLNVSDWLLSHVAELGLTSDDQNLHSDRIKLWNDFNHAWLAILQAQKDMMESGQQTQRNQSPIPQEGLERMGRELVRLCDSIERHGLVDYEYGVWEEQIIAILEECLDLYGSSASSTASHRR